jgi:hypothetical protein
MTGEERDTPVVSTAMAWYLYLDSIGTIAGPAARFVLEDSRGTLGA